MGKSRRAGDVEGVAGGRAERAATGGVALTATERGALAKFLRRR